MSALTPLPQPSSLPAKGAGDMGHLLISCTPSTSNRHSPTLSCSPFCLLLGPLIGAGEKKNQKPDQWFVGLSRKPFPGGAHGEESACQCRRCKRCRFDPWVGRIPWRRKRQPAPVFLPAEFHGQRSLVGYSLCRHKESTRLSD